MPERNNYSSLELRVLSLHNSFASHQKTFKSNQLLAFSPPTDIITWEMDGNYFLQQWKEKSIQPLQLFIVTIDDDVWKNSHPVSFFCSLLKSTHVS